MSTQAIYSGEINHRRFTPKENKFTYSACYYFINLSTLKETFRIPLLFSLNSPGILSFWEKDYLSEKTVRESIQKETGKICTGPIRLLTNISYFGLCFNPVSFYYCYSQDDSVLEYIVSDITNTPWGEKHRQVFEMEGMDRKTFKFPKEFHVSPFMPMSIDYSWQFSAPGGKLNVYMQNREQGRSEILFDSTLVLNRSDINAFNIVANFLKFPFVTLKTVLAIYYQALKLFIKQVPFYTHPNKEKVS